jgi:hypothetical protein
MYKGRTLNPLGIRKVDYQAERREAWKNHREVVEKTFEFYFGGREVGTIERHELERFAKNLLDMGWEEGVRQGVKSTKARVAEALENGTLVKPT